MSILKKDIENAEKEIKLEAIGKWYGLKAAELNKEGIKGKEFQERTIPSQATVSAIDFSIKEALKFADKRFEEFTEQAKENLKKTYHQIAKGTKLTKKLPTSFWIDRNIDNLVEEFKEKK